MTRIILRALNGPFLILMATFGIALQTSLFRSWLLPYVQPDLVLLLVLWSGLKRGFLGGGVITLVVADIAELHASAPQGVFLISYMAIYLLVRLANKVLVIPDLKSFALLTGFASAGLKLIILAVLGMMGSSANAWRHVLIFIVPGALVESGLSLWVYRWLQKYDRWTFQVERSELGLDEFGDEFGDGLGLEPESF